MRKVREKEAQNIRRKREQEREVIATMVGMYCKGKHKQEEKVENGLCMECQELLDYANMRIDKCPFMEEKTFCSTCKVHCYKPYYRSKVKEVMKYAGPRMLFVRPGLVIKHMMDGYQDKKEQKRKTTS